VGSHKVLKPALRLMKLYRLAIDEIQDGQAVTRYTRWIDAVEVRGAQEQEVYLSFSPRFEHIWLKSKQRLLKFADKKPANIGLRSQYAPPPVRLGEDIRLGRHLAHFFGTASKGARAGIDTRCSRKYYPTSAITGLGKPAPESLGYGDQGHQRQDRLAHSARVAGAIRASPGHSDDFCDQGSDCT
jgi:hypothetical protein